MVHHLTTPLSARSDLASVPHHLRVFLELCLSEDASPQVLEIYLPRVREIIINLLQGLKDKQDEYKRLRDTASQRIIASQHTIVSHRIATYRRITELRRQR